MYYNSIVNKEREKNMTKESVFIDAQNGGIGVYIGAGNKVGFAKTAKTLKYILDTKKVNVFEDDIFFTSSMDFAHEEGFADQDGAKELFYSAQELIKDEIKNYFKCGNKKISKATGNKKIKQKILTASLHDPRFH